MLTYHLDYDLVGLNRRSVSGAETVRGDISDYGTVREAFRGCDVVIHLAAYPFPDDNWSEILPANIIGTYNVLAAIRENDIGRLIFASSMSAQGGHVPEYDARYRQRAAYTGQEKVEFFKGRLDPRPDSLYGASKVWGEALCRSYFDLHQISCVCLRLGEVRRDNVPNYDEPLGYTRWCSQEDLFQIVDYSLEMIRRRFFEIAYVRSDDRPPTEPAP